jgi:cytochrome c553
MSRNALPLLALLLATAAGGALADPLPGKAKAIPCAVCHGALGVGVLADIPNLAGQPERYLAEQLKAFRSGKRNHEVMSIVAKPLTDADIADLAAWFASLQVEVREKP